MAAKRHGDGRLCLCDRPDGSCARLAVRRLSQDRVQELAEEIWAAASGDLPPARPLPDPPDPRSSRAGVSAQAAYQRRHAQERERWRLDWVWLTWGLVGAAPGRWPAPRSPARWRPGSTGPACWMKDMVGVAGGRFL